MAARAGDGIRRIGRLAPPAEPCRGEGAPRFLLARDGPGPRQDARHEDGAQQRPDPTRRRVQDGEHAHREESARVEQHERQDAIAAVREEEPDGPAAIRPEQELRHRAPGPAPGIRAALPVASGGADPELRGADEGAIPAPEGRHHGQARAPRHAHADHHDAGQLERVSPSSFGQSGLGIGQHARRAHAGQREEHGGQDHDGGRRGERRQAQ